jgi:hypothetical protein
MPLLRIEHNLVNSTDIMAAAFRSAVAGRRYIEFSYTTQKRYKNTPSRIAARADTVFVGEIDVVKGHLEDDAVFYATTTNHWCIRVYTSNRRVRGTDGYYADKHNRRTDDLFKQGEYLPRTYRLIGINLPSVLVGAGRQGKVRLFPDAQMELGIFA